MGAVAFASWAIVVLGLAAFAIGPDLSAWVRSRGSRDRAPSRRREPVSRPDLDPGRRLRAERRAEALLESVIGPELFLAYRRLGFIGVFGALEDDGQPGYGYLIYPHRPIVSFDSRSGELLSEYCVSFPDRDELRFGERLPDADDVLAKWLGLRGDEDGLLAEANMHLVGRQVDPAQARRDVARLGEWLSPSASPAGLSPS